MASPALGVDQGNPREGRRATRDSIYPHRSVRCSPITRTRVFAALLLAVGLSVWAAVNSVPLMRWHSSISASLLDKAAIPVSGWANVAVFRNLEPGTAPLTSIPKFSDVNDAARLTLIGSVVVLLIVSLRYPLTRNLAYFLIFLLVVSAVLNALVPDFELASTTFGQIWLRNQVLVWILMPWISGLLFVLPQPKLWEGIAWVVFSQLYSIVFSAVRMVFLLGVLHFSGLIFFSPLWFMLGPLADLLFLLLFYSISVYRSSGSLYTRPAVRMV